MSRLRLLTAGESHGPALTATLDGIPHGLQLDVAAIDGDLARRQTGYGRGGRMKIERDRVEVLAGIRGGITLGSPITLIVKNLDHDNWLDVMHPWDPPSGERSRALTRPRPGHADLAGAQKLGLHDARDVLERSSARSTAARVAAGSVCKALLAACGVEIYGHCVEVGSVSAPPWPSDGSLADLRARAEASEMRCFDPATTQAMMDAVLAAQKAGDSLGGTVEVIAVGMPPGIGSHVEWDRRLDGLLAHALMSIQAIKSVEIGLGREAARKPGSQVHDPIHYENGRFVRPTNHAGGIEGGNTNGEPVIARCSMKPIPTLARALASVDMTTKEAFSAQKERTDACAVPALAVIAEAAVAFVLASALLEKTGGDSMTEVLRNLEGYRDAIARY